MNKMQMFKNLTGWTYDEIAVFFNANGIKLSRQSIVNRTKTKKGTFLSAEQEKVLLSLLKTPPDDNVREVVKTLVDTQTFLNALLTTTTTTPVEEVVPDELEGFDAEAFESDVDLEEDDDGGEDELDFDELDLEEEEEEAWSDIKSNKKEKISPSKEDDFDDGDDFPDVFDS